MRRGAATALALLLAPLGSLALIGCEGNQSALLTAGPQADHIRGLWWTFLGVLVTVFVLVMLTLLFVLGRARKAALEGEVPEVEAGALPPAPAQPVAATEEARERRFRTVVGACTGLTAVVMLVLLFSSVATGHSLSTFSAQPALTIKVTGHQWWWEFQYEDSTPSQMVTTANEVHIPVGQPVRFELTSGDVIHSFWVPALHGKRDALPGYSTTTTLQADKPGEYRGQCAEYCGHQHAHMAFLVVADPPEKFAQWLEAQRAPAAEPQTDAQRRGRDVFLRAPCANCHGIGGTMAFGSVAPDLTHLKSRAYLAAETLPNTKGNLAGWIVNSQGIKPGNHMPAIGLQAGELQDLLEYLESLR